MPPDPDESVTVEVEVIGRRGGGPRLEFVDVEINIGGLPLEVRGVRLIRDRDGRRRICPPLHGVGKGRVVDGWRFPPEIEAAVAELLLGD